MRFIDANVFGHAFLKGQRKLTPAELRMKESCKEILMGLEAGEEMATSTVHISEVINLLEDHLGIKASTAFIAWVIDTAGLTVYPVGLDDYEAALSTATEMGIGLNDSLVYHFMRREGLSEVYSMDHHFDKLDRVKRITEI